mmetsp:Transcript_164720/g.400414  ORF Transcript_164720/g.400414 Transcript_164720/m.400414 type:complete len:253 (-) Transcript_164720:6-764(-)
MLRLPVPCLCYLRRRSLRATLAAVLGPGAGLLRRGLLSPAAPGHRGAAALGRLHAGREERDPDLHLGASAQEHAGLQRAIGPAGRGGQLDRRLVVHRHAHHAMHVPLQLQRLPRPQRRLGGRHLDGSLGVPRAVPELERRGAGRHPDAPVPGLVRGSDLRSCHVAGHEANEDVVIPRFSKGAGVPGELDGQDEVGGGGEEDDAPAAVVALGNQGLALDAHVAALRDHRHHLRLRRPLRQPRRRRRRRDRDGR